jgi:hypothetical protein
LGIANRALLKVKRVIQEYSKTKKQRCELQRLSENEVNDLCLKLENGEALEQDQLLALMDSFIVDKARPGGAKNRRQVSRRKR